MTLRERFGLGGLLLVAGAAAATTFVARPFVPAVLASDTDGDGLSNTFEGAFGTNPNDATSDGDMWNDWYEIFVSGTNPLDADTDGDGTDDDLDVAPLDDSTVGGNADGRTTPTSTWSENLTAAHFNGGSAVEGQGVQLHSGEFVHSATFLTIDAGYGPDIVISGTYRSGISYDGIYGQNWVFSFGERVVELGGGDVEYYPAGDFLSRTRKKDPPPEDPVNGRGDGGGGGGGGGGSGDGAGGSGGRITFDDPGGSTPITYTNPTEAIGLTLVKKVDDTFTLTDDNGNETAFRTDGQIATQRDRFGNTVTYSYGPGGDLTSITDATGHSVAITYYPNTGRVKDITDGNSRKVEFTYNYWGQLAKWRTPTSSEYAGGRYFQYRYSNGSGTATLNDNMVRALDPKGQEWLRNEFDASDRTVKQYVGQDYLTFTYATGPTITTVYDREGNQREWAITGTLPTSLKEYSNRNVRASDPTYWQTSFGHTSAGLRNKTVLPRGNRIDTDYDGAGRVTEIRRKTTDTDTDNNTNDIVESFTWDSAFGLMTSRTDALGNVTTYTLEDSGANEDKVVEIVTHPTVTYLAPDQTATEVFTWSNQGQLLTHTDGESGVTTYEYVGGGSVKKGYLLRVIVDSTALDITTEFDHTDWGTLKEVTNPRGLVTTYTVNQYDWVTKIETDSPQSYETLFSYDANGMVIQRDVENVDKTNTRDVGNPWWTTTYTYDMLNNLGVKVEEVTSATTRTWEYEYTKNERLKTLTKPEGNEVRFVYDERDLVYQRTRGYGTGDASTETKAYDENRRLVSYKNGRNKEWVFVYDLFDRRTKTTNPLTNYTEMILDKNGNVTEQKRWEEAGANDVLLAHTKWSYDERDRSFKTEAGLKGVSTWSFLATTRTLDKRGLVTMVTDPRGKETDFEYDGARRRIGAVDAVGNEVEWTLDANGNPTVIEEIETTGHASPKTFVTEIDWDECDRREEERVVDETNASNEHTTTFKYTSLHVMVERVDAESNTTTWVHDGLARVLEESIDLGSSTYKKRFWTYDDNDRLVLHEDDAGNDTVYDYNARDLCIEETFADTGVKSFGYDLADNLTDWEDPNGTVVEITFDDNNRKSIVAVTRGSGVLGTEDETWYYDALDRLIECKDDDVTLQLTWDSLGRKKTEVSGPNPILSAGKTTSYTYDDAGNVTTLAYPDGSFSLTRTYDDVNRLTLVEDGGGTDIVAEEYFGPGGRAKKLTFGNTTTANHAYDGYRWLSDLDHKTSTPTTFAGYDLVRDACGNLLYEEWSHDSGKGHNYAYDKADRLKKTVQNCNDPSAEHATPGSQTHVKKIEYNLTDDSDRTSVVTTPYGSGASTVSYTSNAVHEYTAVGGVNRAYDSNGNLLDDGTNDYHYDYRNQLVRVTRQSDSEVIGLYEYDPLGRRTKKTLEDDSSVRYYHDGHHEIEEYSGGGSLLRKYVNRDEIDSIAMMEAPDQADVDADLNTSELVRLFFHCDGRTNVARLTAAAQTVVESYECDPYGNVTIKDQAGSPAATSLVGNPFVFQRRRHDDESGLMFFRARHYDPQRGHWMQRDPLGFEPGANWHEFCDANPINLDDPLGTFPGLISYIRSRRSQGSRARDIWDDMEEGGYPCMCCYLAANKPPPREPDPDPDPAKKRRIRWEERDDNEVPWYRRLKIRIKL